MSRFMGALVLSVLPAACAGPPRATLSAMPEPIAAPHRPWIIAHRGASALRPEHTLAAYALAIEHGADAIENALSDTTDVTRRPEFAVRRTRRQIDGDWVEDWFSEDFTLAELKTLRAVERLPTMRSTEWDGEFDIPTFDEIVALVAAESRKRGRVVGLVPEIKHAGHFAARGLAMEQPLLDALAAHEYTRRAPVVIQSFETANLRWLRERVPRGGNIRLLQLVGSPDAAPYDTLRAGAPRTYAQLVTQDLQGIAAYADALGPHHAWLQLAPQTDGGFRSALVDAAHAAGLQVFAYTFRPENAHLGEAFRSDGPPGARHDEGARRELQAHASAGVDAVFTDDPGLARRALRP